MNSTTTGNINLLNQTMSGSQFNKSEIDSEAGEADVARLQEPNNRSQILRSPKTRATATGFVGVRENNNEILNTIKNRRNLEVREGGLIRMLATRQPGSFQ